MDDKPQPQLFHKTPLAVRILQRYQMMVMGYDRTGAWKLLATVDQSPKWQLINLVSYHPVVPGAAAIRRRRRR